MADYIRSVSDVFLMFRVFYSNGQALRLIARALRQEAELSHATVWIDGHFYFHFCSLFTTLRWEVETRRKEGKDL